MDPPHMTMVQRSNVEQVCSIPAIQFGASSHPSHGSIPEMVGWERWIDMIMTACVVFNYRPMGVPTRFCAELTSLPAKGIPS